MSKKAIEDLISELEIFVDSCRFQALSSSKIIVPKDELMEMIQELHMRMPGEIERCQKIMRNKEGILTDAREQAEQIVGKAAAEAERLVAEHEIMQLAQAHAQEVVNQAEYHAQEIVAQAQAEANAILNGANADSNTIRIGAMEYTQEKLTAIEEIMNQALVEGARKYNEMLDLIQENLETVVENRQEIEASLYGTPVSNEQQEPVETYQEYQEPVADPYQEENEEAVMEEYQQDMDSQEDIYSYQEEQ